MLTVEAVEDADADAAAAAAAAEEEEVEEEVEEQSDAPTYQTFPMSALALRADTSLAWSSAWVKSKPAPAIMSNVAG